MKDYGNNNICISMMFVGNIWGTCCVYGFLGKLDYVAVLQTLMRT